MEQKISQLKAEHKAMKVKMNKMRVEQDLEHQKLRKLVNIIAVVFVVTTIIQLVSL